MNEKPILLVDDDKIDQITIKRAFRDLKVTNKLIIRENGVDALSYLNDRSNEKPCIILLDLNMPKMNGIEFLQIAKTDDYLRSIPTVVLTTSLEEQDRLNSFHFGVAGYMIKPVKYKQFLETIKTIKLYWTISQLPD